MPSASRHFRRCYSEANKVRVRDRESWILNRHVIFESVLIMFAKNCQNQSVLVETTACHCWCAFLLMHLVWKQALMYYIIVHRALILLSVDEAYTSLWSCINDNGCASCFSCLMLSGVWNGYYRSRSVIHTSVAFMWYFLVLLVRDAYNLANCCLLKRRPTELCCSATVNH